MKMGVNIRIALPTYILKVFQTSYNYPLFLLQFWRLHHNQTLQMHNLLILQTVKQDEKRFTYSTSSILTGTRLLSNKGKALRKGSSNRTSSNQNVCKTTRYRNKECMYMIHTGFIFWDILTYFTHYDLLRTNLFTSR